MAAACTHGGPRRTTVARTVSITSERTGACTAPPCGRTHGAAAETLPTDNGTAAAASRAVMPYTCVCRRRCVCVCVVAMTQCRVHRSLLHHTDVVSLTVVSSSSSSRYLDHRRTRFSFPRLTRPPPMTTTAPPLIRVFVIVLSRFARRNGARLRDFLARPTRSVREHPRRISRDKTIGSVLSERETRVVDEDVVGRRLFVSMGAAAHVDRKTSFPPRRRERLRAHGAAAPPPPPPYLCVVRRDNDPRASLVIPSE